MSEIETIRTNMFSAVRTLGKTDCPCCGQRVQFYRRRINEGMARVLVEIYRLTIGLAPRVAHVQDFRPANGSGDYAKLRFWDLLRPLSKRTEHENASGAWLLTSLGQSFVEGQARVWPVVLVFNNTAYGHDTTQETISISEALGEPFDYRTLVQS